MRNYREYVKELGRQDYFPNTSSVAHFSPRSFTLHIGNVDPKVISGKTTLSQFSRDRKTIATIMHEVTHWADMIGTYWGRQHLRKVFNCYRIVPKVKISGQEKDFWRFVDLHDDERRMRLPNYYHTIDETAGTYDPAKPWLVQFSSGIEFDPYGRMNPERPIIFFKFVDLESSSVVVRQPLTMGALWETTAMHTEIVTSSKTIEALPDGERQVDDVLWSKELKSYLFDREYSLYTAPAHTVAYYAQLSDERHLYRLAAQVAYLCLNLAPKLFQRLSPPPIMSAWRDRFAALKERCNLAFAFAVICANAGEFQGDDSDSTWLERGLSKSKLPRSEAILEIARLILIEQKAAEHYSSLGATEKYLLDIGLKVFDHRAAGCAMDLDVALKDGIPLPPMFNERGEVMMFQGSTFDGKKFDAEDMYLKEIDLFREMRNFCTACR